MVTYLMLLNWTQQGIRNVKDSPERLDAVKKLREGDGWRDDYRRIIAGLS